MTFVEWLQADPNLHPTFVGAVVKAEWARTHVVDEDEQVLERQRDRQEAAAEREERYERGMR